MVLFPFRVFFWRRVREEPRVSRVRALPPVYLVDDGDDEDGDALVTRWAVHFSQRGWVCSSFAAVLVVLRKVSTLERQPANQSFFFGSVP